MTFFIFEKKDVRDSFKAKYTDNLIEPNSSLINNIINNLNEMNEKNNKDLIIIRPKLNRKFIEEINRSIGGPPR